MGKLGPALVAALLVLTGCDQSLNRVSTLWTDVPEMAGYVEKFNASQRDWQLLVEYRENLPTLLTTPGRKADLVVARGLTSSSVKDTLVPLDFLFDGGRLAKASFYRRSLDAGTQGDRTKLLPVSFDLPVLVFAPGRTPGLPGFSLGLDAVRQQQKSFAAPAGTPLRGLAFSPRWNNFGPVLLQLQGAGFHEGFQGSLTWDSAKLTEALALYQQWPSPPWHEVSDFRVRYLQADTGPLLTAGRIQFYPSTLGEFLRRPWEDRRDLDFRYLDDGSRILAADAVIWAGIPSSSLTRGAAERFLAWFFTAEVQKTLIAGARKDDSRGFGLAGGLSAQPAPNTAALPGALPELAARIPTSDQVEFWGPLPGGWASLKSSVLRPWLETATANEATLKSELEKYRSQAVRN